MDDLISRQAAIDAILHITNCKSVRELFEYNQAHHLTEMWSGGVNDAIDAVIGVESATDKNVGTTISRQQAIDAVTDELDMIDHVPQWVFDRLEGRLKQLPPAQLGTNLAEVGTEERAEERTETHACDYISRQQAIDEIDEWIKAFRENGHKESAADACLIQDGIIQLPPAQPEQRIGKWIRNGWVITCSECGYDMPYTVRNFCPNCGAKMEGVAE